MKTKVLITVMSVILTVRVGLAQSGEVSDSLTHQLQEVIVTANQPVTKLVGSMLVSTIQGSNLADLGNALDVLAQLPMINVQDNIVSVLGKNSVEIYIDGRPISDEQDLQQIRSSNLKKVELLMAPGAAYESSVGAVLRIITRHDFVQGVSVTDRFQLQRRRKWSVMDYLGLSYRTGSWELFFDGTINRNNSLAKGFTINTLMYGGKKTVVGSSQHNCYPTTAEVLKTGFNYAKGSQSVGMYYRLNPESGSFTNIGNEWLDSNPVISREIDRSVRAYSHLASMYYENRFVDKYLLHFDGDFRYSKNSNRVSTTYLEAAGLDVNSIDFRKSIFCAGRLSLDFPLWNGNMAIGTQDSYTHTTLDYHMLNNVVGEYIPSSVTDARQTSAALFASWTRRFGKYTLSVGARYEYVDYDFKVDTRRDADVSRCDHLFSPDFSLGYSFNNDAQVSLIYKMSTVKPPYSQLTGSLNYVGLHEIEGGNASLRDERMHDVRLSGMWNGFILQADYVRSIDTYAYVKQLYPANNLQLLMHPVNIDLSALSLYLVWNRPVGLWIPDIAVGVYRQWLSLYGIRYDKPIFSYNFDNTISLPRDWLITVNASGRTQGDMHTNRFGTTWFAMDASIGKTFMNKSVIVKISVNDIFNSANNNWTMNTYGVFVDKRQSYDRRGVSLNITYNFQPRKSGFKGSAASEAEMRRLL